MNHTVNSNEIVIGASNYTDFINPVVGGETKRCGTVPRDWSADHPHVRPMGAVVLPVIPEGEWAERVKEKVAAKSQLSDIWKRMGPGGGKIPSLDQNGRGYCWAHSGTSAVMALRAAANQPYVGLSAYAVACIIKSYRDEGGWGAQGLDFISERGVPSEAFWPMQSTSRSNDRPETWANAALHKVTEGWIDLAKPQYDRTLTREQVATCLLLNVPVIVDYNWWGHSVCALDLVILPSGKFGVRIQNSWGDSWSDGGMGVLDQSKAWPDGATAPLSAVASVN